MSQASHRAESNGNRPQAGQTPFSRQNSGPAGRGSGGAGRASAQQGRSNGASRNKGPRNQGPKLPQDLGDNGAPPGLSFPGPNLLSFGSFNSDASASDSGPSRSNSGAANGPASTPKHQPRQHQPASAAAGLPEKITFGNFQAGSPGGVGGVGAAPQASPSRHSQSEAGPSMSAAQLQQQLAQRQHEGMAQPPPHAHPQIMQRPQSQNLDGQFMHGHRQQQQQQQQQQQLQFGGQGLHGHPAAMGHIQPGGSGYPLHPSHPLHQQQQQHQQHVQMGPQGHQPSQATRAGSSSSSASGQTARSGPSRGSRGSGSHMSAQSQAGAKGMMPNPMHAQFQQMYPGAAPMMWGGYQGQHPHAPHMNDGSYMMYPTSMMPPQMSGHSTAGQFQPHGMPGQYGTPAAYGSQSPQQPSYGQQQPRGGPSRGPQGSHQQGQPQRASQPAPASTPAPAKSKAIKIMNPDDGKEVHVELAKKAERAPSAPATRASLDKATRALNIVAPSDKEPSPKKPAVIEPSKAASAPPSALEAPASMPMPEALKPSLAAPAVDAPLGQPKGAEADSKLTGDAPSIPRGPSEPIPAAAASVEKPAVPDSAAGLAGSSTEAQKVGIGALTAAAMATAAVEAKAAEVPEAKAKVAAQPPSGIAKPDDKAAPAQKPTDAAAPSGKPAQAAKETPTTAKVLPDADKTASAAASAAAPAATLAPAGKSKADATPEAPAKPAEPASAAPAAAAGKENATQNEIPDADPKQHKLPEGDKVAAKVAEAQLQHLPASTPKAEVKPLAEAASEAAAQSAPQPAASLEAEKKPIKNESKPAEAVPAAQQAPAAKELAAAVTGADSKPQAQAAKPAEPEKPSAPPVSTGVKAEPSPPVATAAPAAAAASTSADKKATEPASAPAPAPAPAPAAAPAPSKKAKKLGMSEGKAAGFLDPFAAPPKAKEPAPAPEKPAEPKPEPAPQPEAEPEAEPSKEEEAADDWEDEGAAQLPQPTAHADSQAEPADGRKVYSRDFLRQFETLWTDVPEGLEAQAGGLKDLLNPDVTGARQAARANRAGLNAPPGMNAADRWARPGPGGPGGFAGPGRAPPRPAMGVPPPRMADDSWGRAKPGPPGGPGAPPPRVNRPTPSLHRSDHRYQVGKTQTDDPEEEKKQKEFKSLLNKVTPDTFERILAKVKEVQISEHKTLEGLINQVFDKALIEPKFCELYADLCQQLNTVLPDFEDPEGRTDAKGAIMRVNFRKMLINKCQAEFEKGSEAKAAVDQRDRAKEDAGKSPDDASDDEADKEEGEVEGQQGPQTKEERLEARREQRRQNEQQAMARLRLLGNMQFVGFLFKKKMLTEKIMHFCIQELLKDLERPKREDVECLSKLLATIGGTLDAPRTDAHGRNDKATTAKARSTIDTYFVRIATLSKNQRLESRLRFMLQDTIELRSNGWQARRAADGPKKIEEVHMDAKRELMAQRAAQEAQSRGGGFSRREPMNRPMPPPPQMRKQERPDAPFRTISAATDDTESLRPGGLRLGPGGGPAGGRPATFGRGPAAEAPRPPGPPAAPAAAPSAAKGLNRQPSATLSQPAPEPKLSDRGKRRAGGLLEEYIAQRKRDDAEQDFKELQRDGEDPGLLLLEFFAKAASGRQRDQAANAIPELATVLSDVWSAAHARPRLQSALAHYMELLIDEATDSPFLPAFLGKVLGQMVADNTLAFGPLAQSMLEAGTGPDFEDSLVEALYASEVLGNLLQQSALSGSDVKFTWTSSNLKLSQFFPESSTSDQLDSWKKKYQLEEALA